MRKQTASLCLCLFLAWSPLTVAHAQDTRIPTGSRVGRPAPAITPGNTRLSRQDQGREVTNQLASCLYHYDRDETVEALSLVSETKEGGEALSGLLGPDCYLAAGDLTVPYDLLRGALFRARYLDEFRDDVITLAPEKVDYTAFVPNLTDSAFVSYVVLRNFASCVVRADVENARAFVEGPVGSSAEKAALTEIVPKMGPCLTDGLEVSFSKSVLSSLLSEALYREAAAGKVASQEAAE